ncbi:uncharacterized protein JCM6883_000466 [Sporobolomyces salmoneus]|uniref:uncharacterized protein n=1 Tax=Sporobolomyces salmoneus TaxID=183962 RepID=UPI00316C692A
MEEFDPLNSPSRNQADPIVSTSPFSSLFASSKTFNEPPPLIDFTSSPSPPPHVPKPSFQPKPLSLASSRQSLFPPSTLNPPRRSSPLKFSILEDSFSDFPPSFSDSDHTSSALRSHPEQQECEEGGLVSFVQDSPPPSLARRQAPALQEEKENASPSPTRRGGKKWGVVKRMQEERARRRSRSLSPVKENASSPFGGSTREGDSLAQIGNFDVSLIQDEAGSFLVAEDEFTVYQSPDPSERIPAQSPGNLSLIGEEEEEEEEETGANNDRQHREEIVDEGISVGLSTMFLNKPTNEYDLSMLGDQSKFVSTLAGGGGGKTFDQSTLPRHFQPPNPFPSSSMTHLPRSNSSSSILPPELVSPVKSRPNNSRFPPSASKKPFPSLSAPSFATDTRDESHFSLALPQDDHCSFLDKSSQSFIEKLKSPRKKGRISAMSDISESDGTSESDTSPARMGRGARGGDAGETTEFGFTQLLGSHKSDTSTAILNQLPPTAVLNPESTRTIELCLQAPIRPDHPVTSSQQEEDDLASSTRTIKASKKPEEEIDLMGMEEPSLLFQNQTLAFAGDLTMENHSMAAAGDRLSGGMGMTKETGAERLKRRMAELRAQQSLYTIPATPAPSTTSSSSRFVSLLDQTPQPPPNFSAQPVPRSTVRRTTQGGGGGGLALGRSKSENVVETGGGKGTVVGKLISFDTPSTSSRVATTPRRIVSSSTTTTRRLPRTSLATPSTRRGMTHSASEPSLAPPKTPGERKETTRARLERMRTERKLRKEELLRRSNSPPEQAAGGGGLKRSNSVGNRSGVEKVGITRSQSSSGLVGSGAGRSSLADLRAGGGERKPSTLTERMAASSSTSASTTTRPRASITTSTVRPLASRSVSPLESMPPPPSRRTSLVPPSRIVKRPSLLPTSSSSTTGALRPSSTSSSRPPLKPTTSLSKPAGTGSSRR